MNPSKYAKAIVAVLIAALGAAKLALSDDLITPQEWIDIALVSVLAFSGTYAIPNAKDGAHV